MIDFDKIAVNRLGVKGANGHRHFWDRTFQSYHEAMEAVGTTYIPGENPGLVLVLGPMGGFMKYDHQLERYVGIRDLDFEPNVGPKFINLDGYDDRVDFTQLQGGTEHVLDFTKNWSVGVSLEGIHMTSDQYKVSLFSRGGTHLTLSRGGNTAASNWGLYVTSDDDLYNVANRAQANTWAAPVGTSRILFTYDAALKRLYYRIGDPATGVFNLRSTLAIPDSAIAGQDIDGPFRIGGTFDGPGGATFDAAPWHGGIDDLVVSDKVLDGPLLTEYFQVHQDITTTQYYAELTSYARLGEDDHPEVTDEKGNMVGVMVNGTVEDFEDSPE